MKYKIVHLAKDKFQGKILPIGYKTESYYDVKVDKNSKGYQLAIEKKSFDQSVTHSPETYNYPDKLYEPHRENAYAWGIIVEDELVAAIETDQEHWSNRLRITELWVHDDYQKKGLGRSLMDMAKEQARRERRRAVILETQSCNVNAIEFYQHQGFDLIGLDTCSYKNNDLERKEVRLEFGWYLPRKPKATRENIVIREETRADWYDVELMTQKAFWNHHHLGCDEHYLVHKLRQSEDFIPELTRLAIKDGQVIGYIMYSKSQIKNDKESFEVLTFGPLCVDPKWQGCGVGELLLEETMNLAREQGYRGIVIFGEPDYYPRLGFKTCDKFNITTIDGKNFDAFMGIELVAGGMEAINGKYYYSDVFDNLPKDEVELYSDKFPKLEKLRFPGQWD